MDLNLLSLFSTVAQSGSFAKAARKLGLPRSSVSRQIAELERNLGVQLFNRTTRQVALSTAGAALYERVAPQLGALHQALGTLPERDQLPSGDLRLAATPDFGVNYLADALAGFALRYPGINVDVRLSYQMVDLVAEGFDVGLRIATGRLADSSLIARRLGDLSVDLYAAPDYLARRGTIRSPEDTANHDWILFRDQPPPPPFPRKAHGRIRADDMAFVHRAVRAGLGLAYLPGFLASPDVTAGRLVRLLPRHTRLTGAVYLVHPRAQNVPRKTTAFRDFLVEYIAVHPLALS